MTYEIDKNLVTLQKLTFLLRVCEAIARLDQKASGSPLLDGWRERLLFDEAVAVQWAEGELIHVDELVQLDAGARRQIGSLPLACALQLMATYRRGYRDGASAPLADELPGFSKPAELHVQRLSEPTEIYDGIDKEKLVAWRRVMRQAAEHPPLLHAAIAWDAWHSIRPEHSGSWRATLIASLTLRARALSASFFVPLSVGAKLARYRWNEENSVDVRIDGFLRSVEAGVQHAGQQMIALKHAAELMQAHLRGHRKNSRLAGVMALLLSKPVVSLPMIADHLGMSQRGAANLIGQLGSTPRLITQRSRYRLWQV